MAFALLFNGLAVAQETVLFEEHFDDGGWAARGWYDEPLIDTDAAVKVGDTGSSALFN